MGFFEGLRFVTPFPTISRIFGVSHVVPWVECIVFLRGIDKKVAGFIPATGNHSFFRQDRQEMGGTASSTSGFPVVIGDDDPPISLVAEDGDPPWEEPRPRGPYF